MTKDVMWAQLEAGSLAAGIALENSTQIAASETADQTEAAGAFLERRPPEFTDS
jgi:enoyl-CoA hydratase